jgi:hypothetical protein
LDIKGTTTTQTEAPDRLPGREPLAIGDLILMEVLQGFARDREFETAKRLLTGLLIVELGGEEITIQAAKNFRALRKAGVTVRKTIDTIIATRSSRVAMACCTAIGTSIPSSNIPG